MNLKQNQRLALTALALTLFPLGLSAHAQAAYAQDAPAQAKPSTEEQPSAPVDPCRTLRTSASETRTFYLANISQQNEANDIMVAIRNMLCPGMHVYLDVYQNALIMQGPAEQLALAQKIIADLDRPQKAYRLVYTITELDNGKDVGTQHLSMVAITGQRTSMKEGNKIPVATGSYASDNSPASGSQTQFTYLDIGMNLDATLQESANGVHLQTKVELSSLGQPSTIAGVQEPVVRQTVLEGVSFLTLGKPVMLGSVDVPDTTRHFDIAVVLEQVK